MTDDTDDTGEDNVVRFGPRKNKKDSDKQKEKKQADIFVGISARADLFHTAGGVAYADIDVAGHRETWPVRRQGFKRWLTRHFYEEAKTAPSTEALQTAINVIEAKAHYDFPEREVGLRVAGQGGTLYLDLADNTWRAVEIDENGWRIVDSPPIRFRRAAGMLPLPEPMRGGRIDRLRFFLNVQPEEHFVLAVAWLLAALRFQGPYPVLALAGEQGSAKSTMSKLLRCCVDPNSAPLRALPREDRDLFIAANNGHALVFDNVSGLPSWISDTICRLATGGGFSVRQLYTDQDEILFDAQRPVILNGIEDVVERPDLADRSMFLTLDPIPKNGRRLEREIMADFEKARPAIMGALLDAMVRGLNYLPDTYLAEMPRMADFALWITACEAALWKKGTFISAYTGNIEEATKNVVEGDVVGGAVLDFMTGRIEWTGLKKELLPKLDETVGERITKSKLWPQTPKALGGRLRRLAPVLLRVGLRVVNLEHTKGGYPIHLEWVGEQPSPQSPQSPTADFSHSHGDGCGDHDGRGDQQSPEQSPENPLKTNGCDRGDGGDRDFPPYSGNDDGNIPWFLRVENRDKLK